MPKLPRAEDVTEVLLRLTPPWSGEPKCTLTEISRPHVANVLGQLGRIDWSQKGVGLETIRLIAPDIELTVREKSGIHRDYAFYWEGTAFVDNVTNRLLEADVRQLRLVVIDILVRHVAAQQAKPAPPADGQP